ncbi:MAG: response regulator [Pseudomonadota bacterium]
MSATVLIVEDEAHIVEALTFLLAREGFEVRARNNGTAAWDTILQTPPDILILDAMLPEPDGFEILRRIRSRAELATMPVLMLTAKGQKRDREVAEASGVSLFMTKPFSNGDVVAAVKKLAADRAAERA